MSRYAHCLPEKVYICAGSDADTEESAHCHDACELWHWKGGRPSSPRPRRLLPEILGGGREEHRILSDEGFYCETCLFDAGIPDRYRGPSLATVLATS